MIRPRTRLIPCVLLIAISIAFTIGHAQPGMEFVTEWYVGGEPAHISVQATTGEVFVNINNNYRVVKYTAEGEGLMEFGREGEIPAGIAVDSAGNSVVAVNINNNYRVVRYGVYGEFLAEWQGTGELGGIAVDGAGNSVVAVNINNNYRVVKYGPFGEILASWTGEGTAMAITADPEGSILVVASITSVIRVLRYSVEGVLLAQWPLTGGVIETNGIVVAPGGEIFVTVNSNYRIAMYSAEGEWLGELGSEGTGQGQFLSPAGLAIDAYGRLFVADAGNGRIQVLQISF